MTKNERFEKITIIRLERIRLEHRVLKTVGI